MPSELDNDGSTTELPVGQGETEESSVDYATRRAERRKARRAEHLGAIGQRFSAAWGTLGGRVALITLVVVGVFLITGAGAVALDYGMNAGKIHSGTSVMQFDVGGLTPDVARKKLEVHLEPTVENQVVLAHGEIEWPVTGTQLGLTFDIDAMVSESYAIGRTGSLWNQLGARWRAITEGITVAVGANLDEEATLSVTSTIGLAVDVLPVDASVALVDGAFAVTDGADGQALMVDQLVADLPLAIVRGTDRYEVPMSVAPMGVNLANAQAAADVATTLSAAPVAVTYNENSWEFGSAQVAGLFTFIREDNLEEGTIVATVPDPTTGVALVPSVDPAKVSEIILGEVGAKVGTAPVNATFKTNGGSVSIVPSQDGIGADPARLATDILASLESEAAPKTVTIVTTTVEPDVTTAEAQTMGVVERVSTYTTTFSSGNAPRVNNIKVLAAALDGTLVAPGGQFSFNGTVGERTAAKGYQEAGAIVNGELVNQLGGGICQVNTTLFNAVLLSGLPIDQRRNHSYYIDHYPLGRDATVSWGGPDFKFTNDLDTWVLISTSATNSSVTISIYGTSPGYNVALSTGPWTNVIPHPVTEVSDVNLTVGEKVVQTHGIDGGTIVLTRVVAKGGSTVRSDTFTSKYTTVTEVVRVGTKAVAPAVVPTPTAPDSGTTP